MQQSESFGHDYFGSAYAGGYLMRNPPHKLRYYLSRIQAAAAGGTLLDVGCGYGLFVEFASGSFTCTGCDVEREVVAAAAERVPAASFFQASLPAIPRDTQYDVVTCLDVLEHVPDLDAALANLLELLRPGGILCAVVPVYDGPLGRLCGALDHDETHLHRLSRTRWRDALLGSGFRILRWEGAVRCPVRGRYLHFAGGCLRRIGAACLYLCEAPGGERRW